LRERAGNTNSRGTLGTLDLLIEVGCFEKKVDNVFNVKKKLWSKLDSTRRSTVVSFPLQRGFPGEGDFAALHCKATFRGLVVSSSS
jgi:hypothetical protein